MPRRKRGVEVRQRVNFHFYCTTEAYTRYGKLLRYLSSEKTTLSLREMVLQAVVAFWMPFTHKYFNDLSPEELEHSAARSIYQLQVRIFDLEESFGLRQTGEHDCSFPGEELLASRIDNSVLELNSDLAEIEFDFRCQMRAETNYGKLLRYLKSDEIEFPLREMVLQPAAAFWMPFAHKYFNDLSPEELQQSVSRAVKQLQKQIFYLEERFKTKRLEDNSSSSSTQEQLLSSTEDSSTQSDSDSTDEADMPIIISSGSEWQDLDF